MAPFLISCFLLRLSSPREKTMTGDSTQWRMSPINNHGEKHFVKMTEEKKMDPFQTFPGPECSTGIPEQISSGIDASVPTNKKRRHSISR